MKKLFVIFFILFSSVVYAGDGFVGNYDCTEISLNTYNIFYEYCDVEICIGLRTEVNIYNGNIKEEGHAWIQIYDDVYDPDIIVNKNHKFKYLYVPYICNSYALKIIEREQEFHNIGYDAYVYIKWRRNKKTKELYTVKPYVIYRETIYDDWVWEYIEK